MFLVCRYRNWSGYMEFDVSPIIGLFDNYTIAQTELIRKLDEYKYMYNTEDEEEEYLVISCYGKNNRVFKYDGIPYFSIRDITNGIPIDLKHLLLEPKFEKNKILLKQ